MSLRVEWFNADHVFFTVEVVPHGTEVGEFSVDAQVGIVITGDEVSVIEGSAPILRVRLRKALADLDRLFPED